MELLVELLQVTKDEVFELEKLLLAISFIIAAIPIIPKICNAELLSLLNK